MRPEGLAVLVLALIAAPVLAASDSFLARHRPASELAALAGIALRGDAPALTADEKTNRVILSGSQVAVDAARARLAELDVPPRRLELEVELTSAAKPVWRGRVALLSGVTGRIALSSFAGLTLPDGGVLAALSGRFTATEVAEGLDLRAQLEVTVQGAAGTPPRKVQLTGQSRARPGERAPIGEAATSASGTLGLALTAR